jgi:hypothetical protein
MSLFLRTDHSYEKLLCAQQELPRSCAPAEQIYDARRAQTKNPHQHEECSPGRKTNACTHYAREWSADALSMEREKKVSSLVALKQLGLFLGNEAG